MIPAGVTRIIWAISPNEAVRDAMLGDFAEEFAARAQRDGHAAARRWCWTEALRSLAGTMRRSFPRPGALLSSVVPAMLWGYLFGLLTMTTALIVLLPVAVMVAQVVDTNPALLMMLAVVVSATPATMIAGFETAKAGTKAPLWSALLLGGLIVALSLSGLALGPRFDVPTWYQTLMLLQTVPGLLAGAILQQSMPYRFNPKVAAKV